MELVRIHHNEDLENRIGIARAVRAGSLVFVSGTLSTDDMGGVLGKGCMETQLRRVYETLGSVLQTCGSSPDQVVNETIYVTDMDEFMKNARVRRSFYGMKAVPSATGVEVKRLALPEALVEIALVAAR